MIVGFVSGSMKARTHGACLSFVYGLRPGVDRPAQQGGQQRQCHMADVNRNKAVVGQPTAPKPAHLRQAAALEDFAKGAANWLTLVESCNSTGDDLVELGRY
jgi:hypothetical protein